MGGMSTSSETVLVGSRREANWSEGDGRLREIFNVE